jgi:hypothetical protein
MTIQQRFEQDIEKIPEAGCWVWLGTVANMGYGQVNANAIVHKTRLAHRVSYELYVGKIPSGKVVMHRCDNKLCVNPHHLSLGTHTDNQADKYRKGRQAKGIGLPQHKLTEQEVREIRSATGSMSGIAKQYGISQSAVSLIKSRKRWEHIS